MLVQQLIEIATAVKTNFGNGEVLSKKEKKNWRRTHGF
jgi:hypothetical protein